MEVTTKDSSHRDLVSYPHTGQHMMISPLQTGVSVSGHVSKLNLIALQLALTYADAAGKVPAKQPSI